ncbi:TrkH family potassium uptake protein [Clostridium butyricum]|uniref:V-type sodium ATP synthase subunit J n=1 Tax=Clostridium butyricum E4 str. BoNT E BL5262 TaxID=632245 RepID=C4IM65_CLOBU|nr:potassium transporter TrkG [Clostridium butyricum]EDT74535.1 cation transport protein [Clostridium butyricum 5521]EEP52665.1 V-type sodium ATP synthase subunit J [Clostridium butyricum E4 str. BoNT E BL5262]NFL32238.1 H(+)-transporting ATPase [Clostridium butyricum]NFS19093.1 H(+)-transporting ATPase [Clostridium butyricum]
MNKLKHISPGRLIVLGFFMVIMIGAFLLMSPFSRRSGVDVSFVDALFTSTSAVCVTGLIAIDTADTFNLFGKTVVAMLIQIGGLGVTSIGVGLILLIGRNVGIKQRMLVKEALNLTSMKGIVKLIKAVIIMTISFEIVGAILSYIVFSKDYKPWDAVGISIFHSIAAFNNSGFDVLGNFQNLSSYRDNILLNLVTCGLIIFGGLGFLTIKEIIEKHSFEKFSLHTKIVITMTGSLLIVGTVLLKFTENISWLTAFFYSTSARTAGFSTAPLSGFTSAGLFTLVILMFIGASPGSTGGGIKTTTFFAIIKNVYSASTNKHCVAFKRELSKNTIAKASIIATLSLTLVVVDTFILSIIEPEFSFMQILFEVTSAFGTVGLSTGITPSLSDLSKLIITLTMFIGRLGPLTMATIWTFKPTSHVHYLEEDITIG